MRGVGLAASAGATKDGSDTEEEPEVVPAPSVVGAVDAVVVAEKTYDKTRNGREAVEQTGKPSGGVVSIRARSNEAAVEVPGEEHQDDDEEQQGEHQATRTATLVTGTGDGWLHW